MIIMKKIAKKIQYSIPFNGDLGLMEWAVSSGQVAEIYFAGSKGYNFSSPYVSLSPHTEADIADLVSFCKEKKIKTNFLINKNTLFFDDLSKILGYLNKLKKMGGVDSVTISDAFAVKKIKENFPEVRIQSSIFMGINNVNKADEALRMGVTDLCLDPSINRNEGELKKIALLKRKYPGLRIKLLGVHGCYANCFFAWRHSELPVLQAFVEESRFSGKKNMIGRLIDHDKCHYVPRDLADEIKRPFIRPEDVGYYEEKKLADYIKIAYRNDSSELLKKKLSAYFSRKFDGDLFEILNSNRHAAIMCNNSLLPKNFINKLMCCGMECDKCDYCKAIAKKCIKAGRSGRA
jgi:hypothetical protein